MSKRTIWLLICETTDTFFRRSDLLKSSNPNSQLQFEILNLRRRSDQFELHSVDSSSSASQEKIEARRGKQLWEICLQLSLICSSITESQKPEMRCEQLDAGDLERKLFTDRKLKYHKLYIFVGLHETPHRWSAGRKENSNAFFYALDSLQNRFARRLPISEKKLLCTFRLCMEAGEFAHERTRAPAQLKSRRFRLSAIKIDPQYFFLTHKTATCQTGSIGKSDKHVAAKWCHTVRCADAIFEVPRD